MEYKKLEDMEGKIPWQCQEGVMEYLIKDMLFPPDDVELWLRKFDSGLPGFRKLYEEQEKQNKVKKGAR